MFADSPHILKPADFVWNQERSSSTDDGLKEEVQGNQAAIEKEEDPSLTPRAWWKPNPERTVAVGFKESVQSLGQLLRNNRFDGVFGFSQGAAFAAVLSALLEKPNLYSDLTLEDGKPIHPPFKFCLAVSGFKLEDPYANPIWEGGYNTPTLHILGQADVVVVGYRSKRLAEVAHNLRVEEHVGGHFVPTKGPWRKFLAAYLQDPEGQHASPGAADAGSQDGLSAPASAANSAPGSRCETPSSAPGTSVQINKL